jgi:hypothetical protein
MVVTRATPQRLMLQSPPGALLKRLFGLRARARLQLGERDPAYLAMVRQCPCLKCTLEPAGEAAHVRLNSAAHGKRGALGKKPGDRWTVPLCPEHHREGKDALHRVGELQFWYDLGISPFLVCQKLYAQRGDQVAMRAVILAAIAERGQAQE